MSEYKNICNICGANREDYCGHWKCPACGAYSPSEITSEELDLLYNANQQLRIHDFSQATKQYEDICEHYPSNHYAYWGCLLAKYGVCYEKPSGEWIPVLYAPPLDNIKERRLFKKTIELAKIADAKNPGSNFAKIYEEQANEIEKRRQEYEKVSKKSKKYDIFLSYKDSVKEDGTKTKTQDFEEAQKIYKWLTDKGYNVFFSHETMPRDAAGEKMDAYIFRALYTSQVMILYSSELEYIEKGWVRNEWDRFINLKENNNSKKSKILIGCFKNIHFGDLPEALRQNQCLNAGDDKFYRNLLGKIDEILGKNNESLKARTLPTATRKKSKFIPILVSVLLLCMLVIPLYAYASSHDFWGLLGGETTTTACKHIEVKDPAVPATCTSTGLTEGKHCSKCNEILTAQQTIYKLPHTYDDDYDISCNVCGDEREALCPHAETELILGKPSTCTETGLTDGEKCKICGAIVLKQQTIPLKEHVLQIDEAINPTCSTVGRTEGYHCRVCGKVMFTSIEIPMIAHTYTDEFDESCNKCGYIRDVACRHSSISNIPGMNATCTSMGLTDGSKCNLCGEIIVSQQPIDFAEHILQTDAAVDPTCSAVGKAEGSHCTVCGKIIVAQVDIPMLDHTYDDFYDESCNVCSELRVLSYSEGLEYKLLEDGTYSVSDIGACTDIDIIIPKEYNGKAVTQIGGEAFRFCRRITTVAIPESVTFIGNQAFQFCDALTSINVHKSNSTYSSIDGNLYSKDGTELIQYAIGKNDSSFTVPSSVNTICERAFGECESLETVVIPSNVKIIDDYAFDGCTNLSSVTISYGVTSIGYHTFDGCALTSVNIPSSVSSISWRAFYNCKALESINVDEGNADFKTVNGDLYSKDGTVLLQYAIGKKDTSFTVPVSVVEIESGAFSYCRNLESVIIPGNVKIIGLYAFEGCSISSVTIADGVEVIDNCAFELCSKLSSINIPSSVTLIGVGQFSYCRSLTSINVDPDNQHYKSVDGNLYSKDGTRLVSFACGKTDKTFAVPNGVTHIGTKAFENCYSLRSITLPEGVTNIGSMAFLGCDSLTSITLPEGVTNIGSMAFWGCDSLTYIIVPSSVTGIADSAFSDSAKTIYYAGTVAQWNQIEKSVNWSSNIQTDRIICSDGIVLI